MLLIGAMIFTLGFIQGVISTPEAQLSTKKFLRSIVAPNITTTSNVVYTERATE